MNDDQDRIIDHQATLGSLHHWKKDSPCGFECDDEHHGLKNGSKELMHAEIQEYGVISSEIPSTDGLENRRAENLYLNLAELALVPNI